MSLDLTDEEYEAFMDALNGPHVLVPISKPWWWPIDAPTDWRCTRCKQGWDGYPSNRFVGCREETT